VSDTVETFLYQEFDAGPENSLWPSNFEPGDVIVFKGLASANRSGADTSDIIIRAFIKTLGYNLAGWEYQLKEKYSAFASIGPNEEPFELSIVYPGAQVDSTFQVIQLGFEITTSFDGTSMDSGTIVFSNLEGFIVP
jgi:hypothetical protein